MSTFYQLLALLLAITISIGCNNVKPPQTSITSSENGLTQVAPRPAQVTLDTTPLPDTIIYNQSRNGKQEGWWRSYDQNDRLATEEFYVDGAFHGPVRWYFEGTLVATGAMKANKREGAWTICDIYNPSNCITAHFKNDKKVGLWTVLHDNGRLSKEQYWDDGQLIKESCWDEQGLLIACPN